MSLSRRKKAAPPARYFPLVNCGQRFSEILPRFKGANVIKEFSSAAMRRGRRIPPWRILGRDREFYFSSAAETGTREKWISGRQGAGKHCREENEDGGSLADVISNLLTGPVYEWIRKKVIRPRGEAAKPPFYRAGVPHFKAQGRIRPSIDPSQVCSLDCEPFDRPERRTLKWRVYKIFLSILSPFYFGNFAFA